MNVSKKKNNLWDSDSDDDDTITQARKQVETASTPAEEDADWLAILERVERNKSAKENNIDYKKLYEDERKERILLERKLEELELRLKTVMNEINDEAANNVVNNNQDTLEAQNGIGEVKEFMGKDDFDSLREDERQRKQKLRQMKASHVHGNNRHSLRSLSSVALKTSSKDQTSLISVEEDDSTLEVEEISPKAKLSSLNPEWEKLAAEEKVRKAKLRQSQQNRAHNRLSVRRPIQSSITLPESSVTPGREQLVRDENKIVTTVKPSEAWSESDPESDGSGWDPSPQRPPSAPVPTPHDDDENLEKIVESEVLLWARSRRDIIHLFQSIHEVFDGPLPDLGLLWRNNIIDINDTSEIRKAYL